MSTFSNILPTAGSGSLPQNGCDEQNQPAAATGIVGPFSDLIDHALSSAVTDSKENSLRSQTGAKINGGNHQTSSNPLAESAEHRQDKTAVPQSIGNSIAAVGSARSAVTPSIVGQSKVGKAEKSADKSAGSFKAQKNASWQGVEPGGSLDFSGIPIHQIIAGTMAPLSSVSSLPVKSSLNPGSVITKQPPAAENTAVDVATTQIKRLFATFSKSSSSIPETEPLTGSEQTISVAASAQGMKEFPPPAKDDGDAVSAERLESLTQAKSAAIQSGDRPVSELTSDDHSSTQMSLDSNGISNAKQDITVKQTDKANNIAGQTEKVLPGNAVIAAQAGMRAPIPVHSEQNAAVAPPGLDASEASGTGAGATMTVHTASIVSASNLASVERLQDMVTLNAVRLSDTGNNLMQVVIKPDSGTRLSLELRQHGGTVEVQAVLQQGDFHRLTQQWPDLQHRLGQRGIQLAPLTDNATGSQSGGDGSASQKQQQPVEKIDESYFTAGPVSQIVPAIAQEPVVEPAQAQRGWETWA